MAMVSTLHRISSASATLTGKSCGFKEIVAGKMAQCVMALAAKPSEFNLRDLHGRRKQTDLYTYPMAYVCPI